ncbi:hypothetical protein A2U94_16340 [Bacillus sp. VT 712]|uniref:hypothetical protein n=1 Tax=Priestia flexa TaxID=86664 RepID=UPI000473583B|nr:hypothetical protein [Priestia flexa]KZB90373.1 hypothetical protein A2U94_16340 [Bacillus sp. VT 712]
MESGLDNRDVKRYVYSKINQLYEDEREVLRRIKGKYSSLEVENIELDKEIYNVEQKLTVLYQRNESLDIEDPEQNEIEKQIKKHKFRIERLQDNKAEARYLMIECTYDLDDQKQIIRDFKKLLQLIRNM